MPEVRQGRPAPNPPALKGRKDIVRRYRYLWRGELVAAGAFLLIFVASMPRDIYWPDWMLRGYGIALLTTLLIEGGFWWRGRLVDLVERRQAPGAATLRRFGRLRRINWLLIGIFPLLATWRITGSAPPPTRDLWWGTALVLGATIEQINYFHYQLSYGYGLDFWYLRRHRRLRRGNIARYLHSRLDRLAAAEGSTRPPPETTINS